MPSEQHTPDELLAKATDLLREWLCSGPEFDIQDWATRARNLIEDEIDEQSDF